jgi:hypothetical protein
MTSDNVLSNWLTSLVTFFDKTFYYMTSDNVFSDWVTCLVTFFDKTLYSTRKKSRKLNITFQRSSRHLKIKWCFPIILKVVANHHLVKFCHRLIRCVLTNYFRYTIKLIMADVGQIGMYGEQSRRCF